MPPEVCAYKDIREEIKKELSATRRRNKKEKKPNIKSINYECNRSIFKYS
jgi:hypothetical protein